MKQFGIITATMIASLASCAIFRASQNVPLQTNNSAENCLQLNASYGLRQSLSCERTSLYDFLIAGHRWTFEKHAYQERLRIRIGSWLLENGVLLDHIKEGKIEVWVGTHVFAPELPLMRVQIVASGGNLLIEMPFDPSAWNQAIDNVSILGNGFYPAHAGIKAGKLLVELKPGLKAREFQKTLRKVRGLNLQEGSENSSLFYISTPLLHEVWARSSLLSVADADSGLEQVYFIPAGEVAGEFAKAFEFTLLPHNVSK